MSSSIAIDCITLILLVVSRLMGMETCMRELTMEEVRKAVKRLKNGKAGGDNGMVAEVWWGGSSS